jgi:hypothetical protein
MYKIITKLMDSQQKYTLSNNMKGCNDENWVLYYVN